MISSYTVPINMRLPSVANLREHWAVKMRRARAHRLNGWGAGQSARFIVPSPWVVTLTRVSQRPLDDDNLASALKAFRDGVADGLGLRDDRSPVVQWRYAQAHCGPGESPSVLTTVATREET